MGLYDQFNFATSEAVPTYQGIPLEQLEKTLDAKQESYYKNLADATRLDILNAERKFTPGDEEINKRISEEYKKELEAIAKSGDYENMGLRVNALARKYGTDASRIAIEKTAQAFEQEQELAKQLRAKGLTPLFEGDAANYSTRQFIDGKLEYVPYQSRVEQALDLGTQRKTIWDTLKPDLSTTAPEEVQKGVQSYMKERKWTGITSDKIRNQLENALSEYLDSNEGKQEIRINKSKGMSDEEAVKAAEDKMLSAGMLHVYGQSADSYSAVNSQQNKPYLEGTYATAAGNNNFKVLNEEFDESGNILRKNNKVVSSVDGKDLTPQQATEILIKEGFSLEQISDDPVQQLANRVAADTGQARGVTYQGAAQETIGSKYNLRIEDDPEKTEAQAQEALQPVLTYLDQDPSRFGLPDNYTPEQRRALAGQIYNQMSKNSGNITSKYWGAKGDKVVGDEKVSKLFGELGILSGRNVGLVAPKEMGGGSYKDKRGWVGVQNNIRELIGDMEGQDANQDIDFSAVKAGTSKGNMMGIPGANVVIVNAETEDGNIYQFEVFSEPSEEVARFMAPIQGVYEDVASSQPGVKQQRNYNFGPIYGSTITEVIPQQGPNGWQASGVVHLSSELRESVKNFTKAKELPPAVMGAETFQNWWREVTRPITSAYE